ncbi:thioesterase II family protein [Streptomyces monashensis]|uniref:Thioesterase n=1 Tax=Streptomyces monashensis TaxID=1678012 RepID=A0A1S2QKM1_9ACTN|nr:alpha/beta fold hydrolase [Streptomyces monashensis]OIK06006.1 thioesterase [Streptomyces monashensis]
MTGTERESPWFRNFQPAPDAAVRLVCLPHAGGSASFYFPVAKALSPGVEVLAVQYPGRQDRRLEPPETDLRILADRIVTALEPFTDRPYALFGHSMGAMVGFEAARRLEAAGRGPVELFVSGRRAPALDRDGDRQPGTDEEVIAEIRALNGTGSMLLDDPETRDMILPALRADYGAVRSYRYVPSPPLHCPVTALTGDSDPKAKVTEVAAWEQHTLGTFELNVLPGGHFYLLDRAREVLDTIEEHLAGASAAAA